MMSITLNIDFISPLLINILHGAYGNTEVDNINYRYITIMVNYSKWRILWVKKNLAIRTRGFAASQVQSFTPGFQLSKEYLSSK